MTPYEISTLKAVDPIRLNAGANAEQGITDTAGGSQVLIFGTFTKGGPIEFDTGTLKIHRDCRLQINVGAQVNAGAASLSLMKNSVLDKYLAIGVTAADETHPAMANASAVVDCVAGDILQIQLGAYVPVTIDGRPEFTNLTISEL